MTTAHQLLVISWLTKAKHDLGTARKIAAGPEPYLDTAIYHCQQVAEKVLKGYLAFHNRPVEKTHDLRLLVAQANALEAQFTLWFDVADLLTPYATAYRYPGDVMEPDRAEFDLAFHAAEQLYNFVLSQLPTDVLPR